MKPQKIATIRSLLNGWLVECEEWTQAYTYPDDAIEHGIEEARAKQALFYDLLDLIGPDSKHDQARVRVVIEPGSEYVGEAGDSNGREEDGD